MARLLGSFLVLLALLAGCDRELGRAASASETLPNRSVALRHLPDGTGCDLIGIDYRSITFHIDVIEPVRAETDRGKFLHTYWSATFTGGAAGDLVVRDGSGMVMARDGDVLAIPDGGSPLFGGYWVCPQPDAVYFFDTPAS